MQFERLRQAVLPPEGTERLHELQFGWTDPVRSGVQQMFEYFARILSLKSLADGEVTFEVKMDEPPNVKEFNLQSWRGSRGLSPRHAHRSEAKP